MFPLDINHTNHSIARIEQQAGRQIYARKRAVIYCRVSTDRQEIDGESLEYQEDKCRQYAELHDMDVVLVLHEAKSGYIHYTLRDKLTFARQMIRDRMADVIIVFDLRRFSRNFVHSAMIFEEIESNGGEIVSVSENIDNSLTGKLVRSILAWSAESEREKIVEYANRHWQSRLAQRLPMATGRAPYGWQWADDDKTSYSIDKEEAMVRVSIFTMFVEEDMSLRAIAHRLTEDGILPPALSRGWKVKSAVWRPSTVHKLLVATENIGTITICKTAKGMTDSGSETRKRNDQQTAIPGGIPAIIPDSLYELAQYKLKRNRIDKSHVHHKPEDFLLKSHIHCQTCGYRMGSVYRFYGGEAYGYYRCRKFYSRYDRCPDFPEIKADKVNQMVWADCCRVFESIAEIHDTIRARLEQDVTAFLERTTGSQQANQLRADIAQAEVEQAKHAKGSYYYDLVTQDLQNKQEKLRKYEEQAAQASTTEQLLDLYQQQVLTFLEFLSGMKGRYYEASFKEKRNALAVLGVTVTVHATDKEIPLTRRVETAKEWLSITEAAELSAIELSTFRHHLEKGELAVYRREESRRNRYINRDELNRFLATFSYAPRHVREDVHTRVEVQYSPIFTGVPSSLM